MNRIQNSIKSPNTEELYNEFLKNLETQNIDVRILAIAAQVLGGQVVSENFMLGFKHKNFQLNEDLNKLFRIRIQNEVGPKVADIEKIFNIVRSVALTLSKSVPS